jgi:protein gp37
MKKIMLTFLHIQAELNHQGMRAYPDKHTGCNPCAENKQSNNKNMTNIEWTNETFNPWQGCTKVSSGCLNCYAATLAKRSLRGENFEVKWGKGQKRLRNSLDYWQKPFSWERKAQKENRRIKVFAASMADVFDDEVDPSWRSDFWDLVKKCPSLDWQVLTKRPQNILQMLPSDWGEGWSNVWLGTSVEDQTRADERTTILSEVPAKLRFLSVEPLLGPVEFANLSKIHWVICGGESGKGFRPLKPEWALSVRDQCVSANVPFFFKQWGTANKKFAGRLLEGKIWDEFPKNEGIHELCLLT